jgi:hypothetical protein
MTRLPGKSLSRAIADYLGLSEDALRSGVRSGSSLLDAVAATGRSVEGLRQALVAAIDAGLYKAVREGRLSLARAAALQAGSWSRADRIISA